MSEQIIIPGPEDDEEPDESDGFEDDPDIDEDAGKDGEADFYVRADNRYHAMIDDMLTEGGGKCKK